MATVAGLRRLLDDPDYAIWTEDDELQEYLDEAAKVYGADTTEQRYWAAILALDVLLIGFARRIDFQEARGVNLSVGGIYQRLMQLRQVLQTALDQMSSEPALVVGNFDWTIEQPERKWARELAWEIDDAIGSP